LRPPGTHRESLRLPALAVGRLRLARPSHAAGDVPQTTADCSGALRQLAPPARSAPHPAALVAVWDGAGWLSGARAVEFILARPVDSPSLIPALAVRPAARPARAPVGAGLRVPEND